MDISVLLIGNEGRLRDGLRTILISILGIHDIQMVNDEMAASLLITKEFPSLIILDCTDAIRDRCTEIKKVFWQNGKKSWIIIANTMEEWQFAKNSGADAVLIQGFTANDLRQTMISLGFISNLEQRY